MDAMEQNKCKCLSLYLQNQTIPFILINIYESDNYDIRAPKKCTKFHYIIQASSETVITFLTLVQQSCEFRLKILEYFDKPHVKILVNVDAMPKLMIDYTGGNRLQEMVTEKLVCDTAMSYLSTLGGAFSSLGDYFSHCAEKAGEISLQQFRIALRVGDETLAARCRLYMALSLMQRGQVKAAKDLILKQYDISKKYKDGRLANMCHGVWSKLQYTSKESRKTARSF